MKQIKNLFQDFPFYYSTLKMFAQHKDDKKRVEKALENCGLPSGKVSIKLNFGKIRFFSRCLCRIYYYCLIILNIYIMFSSFKSRHIYINVSKFTFF